MIKIATKKYKIFTSSLGDEAKKDEQKQMKKSEREREKERIELKALCRERS